LKFKLFFAKDHRKSIENEKKEIVSQTSSGFEHLIQYYGNILKLDENKENHNFYKCLLLYYNQTPSSETPKKADEVFAQYVYDAHCQVSKSYFDFLLKFVILFRHCLNVYRGTGTEDFSQVNEADSSPDLCNEFITEFMENNQNFGLDANEVIDLIQHFCYWLYENKYTTSRLTLVN
jgi:hypothetical protein